MVRLTAAGALALLLIGGEDWLVYRRGGRYHPPAPGFMRHEVWLKTSDGVRLHAWFCPCSPESAAPESERLAVIYFHGTFGELTWRQATARDWQESLGCDVLLFDYRGYGLSEGQPSEEGLYRDARAAYDWLTRIHGTPPTRVVLAGRSLGGAVALELAVAVEPRALVLESTFTSLPAAADGICFGLPLGSLMKNRFSSLDRISSLRCSVLITHGTEDRIIPADHAVRLHETARGRKRLLLLPERGHGDVPGPEFYTGVRNFVVENP